MRDDIFVASRDCLFCPAPAELECVAPRELERCWMMVSYKDGRPAGAVPSSADFSDSL